MPVAKKVSWAQLRVGIMAAVAMVNRKGHELDEHTIRHELEGNLCRCTGYHNIVKAIAAGARAMAPGQAGRQAAE